VFAAQNQCPHIGQSLHDAVIGGRHITCLHHGYQYDLGSGARRGRGRSLTRRLVTYRAWIDNGHVLLQARIVDASESRAPVERLRSGA
jgi:nitrite reductase/ring-hydroxylating ferredoxin subunit